VEYRASGPLTTCQTRVQRYDRGARPTAKARAGGRAPLQARSRDRAADLATTIAELQAAGCESLWAITAGLDERGIPAVRGGRWSAVQVARLFGSRWYPTPPTVQASGRR